MLERTKRLRSFITYYVKCSKLLDFRVLLNIEPDNYDVDQIDAVRQTTKWDQKVRGQQPTDPELSRRKCETHKQTHQKKGVHNKDAQKDERFRYS